MIKLNRLTDYAIALLAPMASEDKEVWSASELAEIGGLALPTAAKILKKLVKSDILTAQRGPTGGYRLNGAPSAISIAAIIEAMDGPILLTKCVEGSQKKCKLENTCRLSGRWDKINYAIYRTLANISLASMAKPRSN